MVLKPGREAFAEAIFRKWELDFAVIGHVTDTGRMVLEHKGEIVCDIPLAPLADDAPLYDRPHVPTPPQPALANVPETQDIAADLKNDRARLEALNRQLAAKNCATFDIDAELKPGNTNTPRPVKAQKKA